MESLCELACVCVSRQHCAQMVRHSFVFQFVVVDIAVEKNLVCSVKTTQTNVFGYKFRNKQPQRKTASLLLRMSSGRSLEVRKPRKKEEEESTEFGDLIEYILWYCDVKSILALSHCSRQMKRIVFTSDIWSVIVKKRTWLGAIYHFPLKWGKDELPCFSTLAKTQTREDLETLPSAFLVEFYLRREARNMIERIGESQRERSIIEIFSDKMREDGRFAMLLSLATLFIVFFVMSVWVITFAAILYANRL